jgi:hypothetical protein
MLAGFRAGHQLYLYAVKETDAPHNGAGTSDPHRSYMCVSPHTLLHVTVEDLRRRHRSRTRPPESPAYSRSD